MDPWTLEQLVKLVLEGCLLPVVAVLGTAGPWDTIRIPNPSWSPSPLLPFSPSPLLPFSPSPLLPFSPSPLLPFSPSSPVTLFYINFKHQLLSHFFKLLNFLRPFFEEKKKPLQICTYFWIQSPIFGSAPKRGLKKILFGIFLSNPQKLNLTLSGLAS